MSDEDKPAQQTSAPIYDDKAHVRGKLDLTNAEWQTAADTDAPDYDPDGEYVQIAFVPHTDDKTYIAMRNSKHTGPDDTVLVFTESEWDAFVQGARAGEFDEPW
ncbi:uncharacterized protein DUF397 [Herbihabitans rhizosphaerae]|uniref:Uncharacterized protein DUF397 n=1 Tax=Herbihabitans rhizosphaerae TaxID=1872711 RepID=A0A4Q7KQJ2_9PSEU|nr:DUF397 domain-containing protein [Herbihabitans rhizosphaerae]RZS39089.1 uncharacterized protein DUF397 [Herbihabitans rhizosphaerae]